MSLVRRLFSNKIMKRGGIGLIVFFTLKGVFYLFLIALGLMGAIELGS